MVAAPAAGVKGFGDSGIMTADELIDGEAGGMRGFLHMDGFMDESALSSFSMESVGGKERF